MQTFLSQVVIMAYADSIGFQRRPEVTSMVQRMARYMLTQSNGPFYQALYRREPITDREIDAEYRLSRGVWNAVVARFSDRAAARALLGSDFRTLATKQQIARIERVRRRSGVEVVEGRLAWPFHPFVEIRDLIGTAPPGKWLEHEEPFFGFYYIYIRSISRRPDGQIRHAPAEFRRFARYLHEQTERRRRRAEQLSKAGFRFQDATGALLVARLDGLPRMAGQIPPSSYRSWRRNMLFRYHLQKRAVAVDVGTFCRHFNSLLIRRIPRTMAQLQESAADMAMEDLDLGAARALHLDETPRFEEDRHGFAGYQMLDLFEKETLRPQIRISAAQIEDYYRAHTAEFSRPTAIRGRLLKFSSMKDAGLWAQRAVSHELSSVNPDIHPLLDEETKVPGRRLPPPLAAIQSLILQSPDNSRFGPCLYHGCGFVFIKEVTMATGRWPLSKVSGLIRGTLMRRRLDARERVLAVKLARRFKVIDRIDYARYHLRASELALPWRGSAGAR